MSDDLRPCPFCGEAEELYQCLHGVGGGKPFAIDCLGCGAEFRPREGADVIAAWNRRPGDPKGEAQGRTGVSDKGPGKGLKMTTPLDVEGLKRLLRERIGQDFDGECHLTEAEALSLLARIEEVEGENRRLQTEVLNAAFSDRLDMEAGGSPLTWKEIALAAEASLAFLKEERDEARAIAKRVPELEFQRRAKGAELEIADGEINRLNALVTELRNALVPEGYNDV